MGLVIEFRSSYFACVKFRFYYLRLKTMVVGNVQTNTSELLCYIFICLVMCKTFMWKVKYFSLTI